MPVLETSLRSLVRRWMLVVACIIASGTPGVCASIPIGVNLQGELVRSSSPKASFDGQLVAFVSPEPLIVPSDTNFDLDRPDASGTAGFDVFVRDRATCQTDRVSVSSGGVQADDDSTAPDMSPDGRFVVFSSLARNLVPGTPPNRIVRDIYLHDRQTHTTERISIGINGSLPDRDSGAARVSSDGRYIAYSSTASNLVPDDTNYDGDGGGSDVFLFDRANGATRRISVTPDGNEVQGASALLDMSEDATRLLMLSTGEVLPGVTGGTSRLYLVDLPSNQITLIDKLIDGTVLRSDGSGLSADGCTAIFSIAFNQGLARYDCVAGSTDIILGEGGGPIALSADATRVAFFGQAGAFGSSAAGAFLHDADLGATTLITPGAPLFPASISGDGRVFVSSGPVVAYELTEVMPSSCELAFWCATGEAFDLDYAICPLLNSQREECGDTGIGARGREAVLNVVEALRSVAMTSDEQATFRKTIRHGNRLLRRMKRAVRFERRHGTLSGECREVLRTLIRTTRSELKELRAGKF